MTGGSDVGRIIVIGERIGRAAEDALGLEGLKILDEIKPEDVTFVQYRCNCGLPHKVAVLPYSPRVAKHHCRECNRVNEIETRPRDTTLEDSHDLGNDEIRVAKKKSVEIIRP